MDQSLRAGLLLVLSTAVSTALGGCGNGGGAASPPPVTGDEQQALSDAAEMLDERADVTEPEGDGDAPVAAADNSIE